MSEQLAVGNGWDPMSPQSSPSTGPGPRAIDAAAVVAAATGHYLAGRPIDMSELALELGVGRATLYRRVGKHEDLLAVVLAEQTERTFRSLAAAHRGGGIDAICEVLSSFVRAVVSAPPLLALIARDPVLFVRVVLGPGPVEDRGTALVEALIRESVGEVLVTPAHLIARAIVRMSDATMYTHLLSGRPAELADLAALTRVLLVASLRDRAGTRSIFDGQPLDAMAGSTATARGRS